MDFSVFLASFTALFVIVDPISAALIYHAMLPVEERSHRRLMAIKATSISTVLLIVFGLYGAPFLHYLGIDINSLRIAGGLLLFYTAFGMITQGSGSPSTSTASNRDISVYPLTIPLLAGPGSLTLVILLFAKSPQLPQQLAVHLAIISVMLITLVMMLVARQIKRLIGHTGDEILQRFLGVILAALAIQFIHDGIKNLIELS